MIYKTKEISKINVKELEKISDLPKQTRLDSFILKYARAVDDIDMFLAPLSTLALWHDNQNVKRLGIAAAVLDVGVIKTPFVMLYILRTGDYKSAVEWLGWEALAHAIPYEGGLLSIRRNYENSTKEHYNSVKSKNISVKKR